MNYYKINSSGLYFDLQLLSMNLFNDNLSAIVRGKKYSFNNGLFTSDNGCSIEYGRKIDDITGNVISLIGCGKVILPHNKVPLLLHNLDKDIVVGEYLISESKDLQFKHFKLLSGVTIAAPLELIANPIRLRNVVGTDMYVTDIKIERRFKVSYKITSDRVHAKIKVDNIEFITLGGQSCFLETLNEATKYMTENNCGSLTVEMIKPVLSVKINKNGDDVDIDPEFLLKDVDSFTLTLDDNYDQVEYYVELI